MSADTTNSGRSMRARKVATEGGSRILHADFWVIVVSIFLGSDAATARAAGVELSGSGASIGDHLGISVAVDSSRLVAGASKHATSGLVNAGAAYLFVRGVSGSWSEQQLLSASDPATNDEFGGSVAISGDSTIIGAYRRDSNGMTDSGGAYVFAIEGNAWVEKQKLIASDAALGDGFGQSVALSGPYALVGAPGRNSGTGAGYVFERQGNGSWSQVQILTASDGGSSEYFGVVAISGDRAIVGASGHPVSGYAFAGGAYIFERQSNGTWLETAKLSAIDAAAYSEFGAAVAISGDHAIVGARNHYLIGTGNSGVAYCYERQSNGTWSMVSILNSSDATPGDAFGLSVSMSGDRAVVGANGHALESVDGAGAAYVFEPSSTGVWLQTKKLTAKTPASQDRFGSAVAVDGSDVTVGAASRDSGGILNSGAVFAFGDPTNCSLQWVSIANAASPSVFKRFSNGSKSKKFKLTPQFDLQEIRVALSESGAPPSGTRMLRVSIAGSSLGTGHESHGAGPSAGVEWYHGWLFDATKPKKLAALKSRLKARIAPLADPGGLLASETLDLGGGVIGRSEIQVETDGAGEARFRYLPAEVSGTDTITVEVVDPVVLCDPWSAKIEVRIAGLEGLEGAPMGEWILHNEASPIHASVHHGTVELLDALREAALDYVQRQATDPALSKLTLKLSALSYSMPVDYLQIGTISLPMGGLLDVGAVGGAARGGHRFGTEADIWVDQLVADVKDPEGSALGDAMIASEPTNELIRKAQARQFALLKQSLASAGLKVTIESGRLHVSIE